MSAVSGDFHGAAAIARPRVQVGGNDRNAVHEYLRDIMPRQGLARRQPVSAPQHDALDALFVGITAKRVHFYFDADVRSFFHEVNKSCLVVYRSCPGGSSQNFVDRGIIGLTIGRLDRHRHALGLTASQILLFWAKLPEMQN